MAFLAASLMCSGALKSGSPKLRLITFTPFWVSSRLSCAMRIVADSERRWSNAEGSSLVVAVVSMLQKYALTLLFQADYITGKSFFYPKLQL